MWTRPGLYVNKTNAAGIKLFSKPMQPRATPDCKCRARARTVARLQTEPLVQPMQRTMTPGARQLPAQRFRMRTDICAHVPCPVPLGRPALEPTRQLVPAAFAVAAGNSVCTLMMLCVAVRCFLRALPLSSLAFAFVYVCCFSALSNVFSPPFTAKQRAVVV